MSPCSTPATMSKYSVSPSGDRTFTHSLILKLEEQSQCRCQTSNIDKKIFIECRDLALFIRLTHSFILKQVGQLYC